MEGKERKLRPRKNDESLKESKFKGKMKPEQKKKSKGSSPDRVPKVQESRTSSIFCDFTDYNGSGNVVNVMYQLQTGFCKPSVLQQIAERYAVHKLKYFFIKASYCNADSPRITALQWHPRLRQVLAVGGKHGELKLITHTADCPPNVKVTAEVPLTGPGGTVEDIRFKINAKENDLEVFTASVDGTLSSWNFCDQSTRRKILVATKDRMSNWFCCVGVGGDGKTVCGGDNKGTVVIHHLDSGNTEKHKLHAYKVKHLEFNTRNPHMLVTSSLDKTVKLWDLRMIKDKQSCLEDIKHETGVSAAKFSLTDGCRLLTCDMDHELRVYKAPLWTLESTIDHPHRSFQHMTNILPSWHPTVDIFAIGCYPDPNNPQVPQFQNKLQRSIDIFSASKRKLVHELVDSSNRLITSLAMFNSSGYVLATSSGKQDKQYGSFLLLYCLLVN